MPYDSTNDTKEHIGQVRYQLARVATRLLDRALAHDRSKLGPVEKPLFDKLTPKLKELEYGSDEYKQSLKELGPALTNHYQMNSHHPEHYEDGVYGMCLIDLIEMLCDWRAAAERTKGGYSKEAFAKSMQINKERFGIDDKLYAILYRTAERLDYV